MSFASTAWPCGSFKKPATRFDGVNEFGHVAYWDQIGELNLGDGNTLPLIIGFRSDWESMAPSPHLGAGWLLGLLDARFVQRSQDAFDMISIDGYTVPFGRDPKNPSILNGAQGYKAELKGNKVNVWASCGWKFEFAMGKIASLTTSKDRVIQIRRGQDGVVSDVLEGTNVLLKVERSGSGAVAGLSLGDGRKIELTQVEKPQIQSINGVNVVGSVGTAIGKIALPNGSTTTFSYTPNGKLQPTISINAGNEKPRIISWDAATGYILSDATDGQDWTYVIEPKNVPGTNAAITRVDSHGNKELWNYDSSRGEERIEGKDGSARMTSWFTSGKLAGKIRKVTVKGSDGKPSDKRWVYDENGFLVRRSLPDGSVEEFVRDEKGRLTMYEKKKGSDSVERHHFDELGRLSREERNGSTVKNLCYPDAGIWSPEMLVAQKAAEKFVALSDVAKVEARAGVWPDEWTYHMFDKKGRAIGKITPNGDVMRYGFGDSPAGIASYVNGVARHIVTELGPVKEEQFFANDGALKEQRKTSYNKDTRTRVIQSQRPGQPVTTTTIKYDERSRIVELHSPSGTIYHYEYDESGHRKTTNHTASR